MITLALALSLLQLQSSPAKPAPAPAVAPPEALAVEGVPPISPDLVASVRRYSEARAAVLLGWHPVRREILIQTRFADTAQIHEVRFPGGARRQLTFFPDRVAGASYPPAAERGDHFVFAKDTGGSEFYQLYRYDQKGQAITLLTDGKSRNTGGVFSRPGTQLVYTSTRRTGADTDLYVMDPRDPKTDRLLAQVAGGGWRPLDISADGKTVLVEESLSVNEGYLWLFDVATGARTLITPKGGEKVSYDGGTFLPDGKRILTRTDRENEFVRLAVIDLESKAHRYLTSHIKWDVEEVDVTRDGKLAAFVVNEDGQGVLHLMDLRTGVERPRPKLPPGLVSGIDWHENGRDLGFTLSNAQTPSDVFSLDVRTGKVDRWTESETGGLDTSGFSEPELVRWRSFDGQPLSGYLYKPSPRFTGKRPVVISIHGGPEGQARPTFLARNRYLLEELGVALLQPNVRGSTGYGKTFVALDNGVKREDSVKDIGTLLDWVKTRPDLDAERVLIMGGSYGGYMTFASSVHFADRIRASIAVVGISNFVSFLERTEAYRRDLRRVEYGDERDPQMRAFLQRISPLTNAARITKPIFVVQGRNDPRVPLHEAEQMVASLKSQKTPVWYMVGKDEGHGFAKKRNADFLFYATVAFMQAHLLP